MLSYDDEVAALVADPVTTSQRLRDDSGSNDDPAHDAGAELMRRLTFVGYMGKSTRMIFPTPSRSNPDAYVPVYAFEDVPEETDGKKETRRFLNS